MEVSLDAESKLAVVRAVVCEHADYKECTVWHRLGIACKVLCVTHFFFFAGSEFIQTQKFQAL